MMLTSALLELILVDHDLKSWQAVIPRDDQSLKRDFLRSFLSYFAEGELKSAPIITVRRSRQVIPKQSE
ncbi:MAG TPA: hypothetical protein VEK33_03005 [Terriglobales bacterium]|nr:hypothetical protein [Terriglobales bacterium]